MDQTGGARRERRTVAGVEETPGKRDTPGWRARVVAAIAPDPREYDKLELVRNVRRAAQRTAIHTVGRKANGDVSVLLLHSDPENPGPGEIARVFKYVLYYGRMGAERPMIQKKRWKDAAPKSDERIEERALCARLLNS